MRIRWTVPAVRDLAGICDYIEVRSGPKVAQRIALRIYERIDALILAPYGGRQGRVPGTRELIFSGLPFLAIYRVRDEVIEINRILHGAQRWPS
jgi:plasmid stabilization system protein ParE